MIFDFLTGLTRDVVEASRVRPGQSVGVSGPNRTGGTLIKPGGRECYPAFWVRDHALSLASRMITLDEQRHALLLTAATQQAEDWPTPTGSLVPRGAIADHITFEGIPIFFPGTYDPGKQGGLYGKRPALDDHFFFIEMAWQFCRQSGNRALLGQDIGGLTLSDRLELAFSVPPARPDTQLVWCAEGDRGVSFGFTDSVIHTGELLFASLLRHQAALQLAELTGNSRYRDLAASISRALPSTFPSTGGLLCASTGLSRQPDVWGSALAVYTGAVDDVVGSRICGALAEAYRQGTLALRGGIRHLLTTDDFSTESAWERTVDASPINTYQNGAYWGTATGWVCFAIALVDEPLAKRLAGEYIAALQEGDFRKGSGFGEPYECFHPVAGYRQNPVYMTSVTCPLAAFRRLGWMS